MYTNTHKVSASCVTGTWPSKVYIPLCVCVHTYVYVYTHRHMHLVVFVCICVFTYLQRYIYRVGHVEKNDTFYRVPLCIRVD